MNTKQLERMRTGKGFIAALDQSGGSTPKALAQYGISEDRYHSETEMFDLVHAMRTRMVKSPAFSAEHILGAILFEGTMDRAIDGAPTADYLWEKKGVVPFLKVDKGLAEPQNGVQLMKPMPELDALLKRAVEKHIFGTKMRSFIREADPKGIADVVEQQFAVGKQIAAAGLVPILEPEVDIHLADRSKAEELLLSGFKRNLAALAPEVKIMIKVSIPAVDDFYRDLMRDPHVVRVVALSGGYSRDEADARLARNHGLIASFSRALAQGLSDAQSDAEFDATLAASVKAIYEASVA